MIFVAGATGTLGGRVTKGLLAQGKAVRFIDRSNPVTQAMAAQGLATSTQALVEAGAQAVPGDLKDRASLDAALKGVDTVVATANAVKRGGEDTIESVDLYGMSNLIAAAQAAGVRRFQYVSVPGAAPEHPIALFRYKGINEVALQKSGMNYTIFRPTVFMEVWIGSVVGIPLVTRQAICLMGKGDHHHNFISEADVAAFMLTALEAPRATNQILTIGGPASYTWTEIVAAAGKILGTSLPVEYLPFETPVPYLPEGMQPVFTGMETFETYVDMSEHAPAYGVRLTGLEEFLKGMLWK